MNPKREENKMTPYLKRYRMKITALGPIHVGDGKKLKKIEYIYDKQNNRVFVLDATKTYSYLEQEGKLGRFQEYILSPEKGHKDEDNSKDIFSFLLKENISKEIWESWKSYDYVITEREDTSLKEIHSFVKDANGRPYVPGSSIKGMIRTALLAYLLGNKIEGSDEEGMFLYRKIDKQQIQYTLSKAKKESIAVGKRDLRKESVELEALVFHQLELRNGIRMENQRNAVCSILRGLLVRDSQPLSLKDLDLAQKVDLFSENSRRRDSSISRYNNEETNSISMFREVLRPGTEIYFDLILDSKVFPYSLDTILAALDYFNEQCYYYHYKHFQRPTLEKGIVWLGGGAGYCTKTVSYPLLQEEGLDFVSAILAKNFSNYHDRDKELGVSPRTTPIFTQSNHTYDQGMGKIELVES